MTVIFYLASIYSRARRYEVDVDNAACYKVERVMFEINKPMNLTARTVLVNTIRPRK